MSDRRALLTEREREIVAGDAGVSDSYRYQTISRVRARFNRLEEDLEALEAHGELAEEFRDLVCGSEHTETTIDETHDRTDSSPPPTGTRDSTPVENGNTGESSDTVTETVERVAQGWEDTADRLEARKAAARAVLDYAREHGSVSKQEAKEEIYPENPVDGQTARTWYRKNIRPVLNEAAEYDQSERAYQLLDAVDT